MADLARALAGRRPSARPFPPGDYPVVVVGSGPGALQFSYALGRLGIDHAVISADPSPGGMFRRWPFFQRLLSWTKPYAPGRPATRAPTSATTGTRCCPTSPALRALQVGFMDGTVGVPVAPGDGGEPRRVRRAGRDPDPLRLPLGIDPPRGGPGRRALRPRHLGRRVPLPGGHLRGRRRRAVAARRPGHGPRRPLRGHAAGRDLRRQAPVHRRQAEQRLRARLRPPPVGEPDRPRLAVAGQAVGQHPLARRRPGALRPAVRGPQPGRRRVDPRRRARPDRARRRRVPGPPQPERRRRARSPSMPTRSSPRPGSSRRCATCPTSASRRSARAACRR